VESGIVLAPGQHALRFEFEPTGEPDLMRGRGAPGRLQLYVDGTLTGTAEAPVTTPFVLNPGALTCGANPGSAITDDYASPFRFTGTIHSVTVDVSGKLTEDSEAELRMHMARQ
jgi:arylsulfatase